jgi:hypothetical protein
VQILTHFRSAIINASATLWSQFVGAVRAVALPERVQGGLPCNLTAAVGLSGYNVGTLTSTFCRMSDWQTRLSNLEGLSDDDKLFVKGELLALGDNGTAARFFKDNETDKDTVRRLRSLMPEAGETRRKVQKRKHAKQVNSTSTSGRAEAHCSYSPIPQHC